jgi:hypothetical protein
VEHFDPLGVPFTLVCEQCDAGQEIRTQDEAEALGWTLIIYAPDLPMANYVGICPDCLRDE